MSSAALVEVDPPAVEPVLLGEAKLHLRVDAPDDDGLIDALIRAARLYCEGIHGRAYIKRTYRLELDAFPAGVIYLPKPPAIAVVFVTYFDSDGIGQTLDASSYEVDTAREPARLRPISGTSWPATADQLGAVRITYTAGYGEDPTDVPEDIRAAVKLALGDLYEYREPTILGLNVNTTHAIEALLWPTRVWEGTNR